MLIHVALFAAFGTGVSSAFADSARGTVGFSIAAKNGVDQIASGLCIDEMVEIVLLDGRLELMEPRASSEACGDFDDSPLDWARCAFESVPTVSMRVDARLEPTGYRLDVRYVTASGDSLDNSVSVHGDLRDILLRCRHTSVVLVEALFGDIRIPDRLLGRQELSIGERSSTLRRKQANDGGAGYVWQRSEGDRVGDFRPRRDRGYYESGPGYLSPHRGPGHAIDGAPAAILDDEYGPIDANSGGARDANGYFILEGGARPYYDWQPRTPSPRSRAR